MTPNRTPAETVLALYLAFTLPLYFVVGDFSLSVWGMYALHVLGLWYFVSGYRLWFRLHAQDNILRDLLPLIVCAALYSEVAWLNRAFFPHRYLDSVVIAWEYGLFGSHPAMDFRRVFPASVVAEYLHFGYFSYYLLMPLMAVAVLARSGRNAFRLAAASVVLVFALGFVIFILFPVAGPYYEYPRMDLSEGVWFFPRIARWAVDKGSAIGTAFPSSHVSVAVTIWIMCFRYARGVGVFLTLIVPALVLGAVYGGFHYALDIILGAVLGVLAGTVGHHILSHRLSAT